MQMNEKVRVVWGDIEVGRQLKWDVYNESGKLLLKAGHVIPNQQVLDSMHKYVLYRYVKDGDTAHSKKEKRINVFATLDKLVMVLKNIHAELDAGDPACLNKIGYLVKIIQALCKNETDETIAAFHLPNDYPYSVFHSIQCAIICALISSEEDWTLEDQEALISAALTANVGMHELQDVLAKQDGMLTPDQDDEVKLHPEKSFRLLKKVGVENDVWLSTVMQHHEIGDASGYPLGLNMDEIGRGAKMLALADRYGAMVTMRDYRKPVFIKEALGRLLMDKGKSYDEYYAQLMIKVLSVYPPGSFVQLNNGEIAIVVKRGLKNSMKPIVKSFLGPDKKRYVNPLRRECGVNEYEVASLSGYDPAFPLNYNQIWEYV